MKRFQLILILVCLAIVSSLIIYFVTKYPKVHEAEEMVVPSMVIDGLFFTERPEPLPENSRAGYFKEPDGNRISVIETANGNIRKKSAEDECYEGMGTTVVAASCLGKYLQIADNSLQL